MAGRYRNLRPSPIFRVIFTRSQYSSSSRAYLRETPSWSLAWARVNTPVPNRAFIFLCASAQLSPQARTLGDSGVSTPRSARARPARRQAASCPGKARSTSSLVGGSSPAAR